MADVTQRDMHASVRYPAGDVANAHGDKSRHSTTAPVDHCESPAIGPTTVSAEGSSMRFALGRNVLALGLAVGLGAAAGCRRGEPPAPPETLPERIGFTLQTRDRKTGTSLARIEKLDPRKVGVVVV